MRTRPLVAPMQCATSTHYWSMREGFSSSITKSEPHGAFSSGCQRLTVIQLQRGDRAIRTGNTVGYDYADIAGILGQHVHQSRHCVQTNWVRVLLISCHQSGLGGLNHSPRPLHRRLTDARDTYKKVIEIDPRNVPALVFLGSVYQLLDDPDRAIVKYHEVSSLLSSHQRRALLIRISRL